MNTPTTEQVEKIAADAQKQMEEGVAKMTKGMEEAAAFSQETVEAMMASGKIIAKATESMGAEMAAFSKKAYEDSLAAAKELSTCKSVTEFVEKQTNFTKTSFEGFVAEATKLNEMYAAAAREAFEPLTQRFSAAVEIVKAPRL